MNASILMNASVDRSRCKTINLNFEFMDVRTYNFECAAALNAAFKYDANNFYALYFDCQLFWHTL